MQLESIITAAWAQRDSISFETYGDVREAVNAVIDQLDAGSLRVAEKKNGAWVVNQWVKQAILLSFRLHDNRLYAHAPYDKMDADTPDRYGYWWDKVPSKFAGWNEPEFRAAGFRAVPGCYVRRGSFVAPKVVLMPSFVNLGAYVGEGTMVDTWVTIGSCAQIGKNCHISGGVGIGGVLEPLQANPVIIEDNCFIGARSEIAEGVIVEEGSVISMGVFIGASTKIVDRATGEVMYGRVPAYSVVVPGTLPPLTSPPQAGGREGGNAPHLAAAIIVKRVDEKTRSKTSVNELLRD